MKRPKRKAKKRAAPLRQVVLQDVMDMLNLLADEIEKLGIKRIDENVERLSKDVMRQANAMGRLSIAMESMSLAESAQRMVVEAQRPRP